MFFSSIDRLTDADAAGWAKDGSVWFASEMKVLVSDCTEGIQLFDPGSLYDSAEGKMQRWYEPVWWNESWFPSSSTAAIEAKQCDAMLISTAAITKRLDTIHFPESTLKAIRETLELAVQKRLMSDVKYGVLLSGGLDSSLIAAIASRTKRISQDDSSNESMRGHKLLSFSIGLENSPDLVAARKVANYLGTEHHEFTFTIQEGWLH